MRSPVAGIVLCLVVCYASSPASSAICYGESSDPAAVLANHRIWGRAFPTVLRHMEAWVSVREVEVVLHRTRLVGSREFEDLEGRRAAAALEKVLRADPDRRHPAIDRWWGGPSRSCRGLTVNMQPRSTGVVLEVESPDCEFIAADVTIDLLRKELGAPESIEHRILSANGDRTEMWILYSYAGGAVKFVESSYGVRTGGGQRQVDRALLSPLQLARAIEMQR